MTPTYDPSAGFDNVPGLKTGPWHAKKEPIGPSGELVMSDEFGGIKGVDILLEIDGVYAPVSIAYMFHDLLQSLTEKGYVPKETVFGAPYDFRIISSREHADYYYRALKLLIERAAVRGPVAILCHSLGCPVTKRFLTEWLPQQMSEADAQKWKDDHIKVWIPVGGPFGGAPASFRTAVSGDDEGMGALCQVYKLFRQEDKVKDCLSWYQSMEKNLSGVAWMLPDPTVYQGLQIFKQPASSPPRDILTPDGLRSVMKEVGAINTAEAFLTEISSINLKLLQPPMVNTHAIVGVAKPTEIEYSYPTKLVNSEHHPMPPDSIVRDGSDYYRGMLSKATPLQMEILASNELGGAAQWGDKTVPWLALHLPKIWLNGTSTTKYSGVVGSRPNQTSSRKYVTNFKEFVGTGYEHRGMLNDKEVIHYIIEVALG